jgi:hypothetical protein
VSASTENPPPRAATARWRRRAQAALAVALAALAGAGAGAACNRDAAPAVQPVGPEEPPPLPTASGSPIGFLLDDPRLSLRDDQRTQLHAIDGELAEKLIYLDSVMRNTGSATAVADDDRRGGIEFGASRATGSDVQRVGSQDSGGPDGGARSAQIAADNAAIRKRVPEVRAHDVRDAIARAFAVLDPPQRDIARKLLVERGVDPETGKFEAQGEPGAVPRDSGPVPREPVK